MKSRNLRPRLLAGLLSVSVMLVGAVGAVLVARARSLPYPAAPVFTQEAGRVVAVTTSRCGTKSRPHTCHRPVVDYVAGGQARQTISRSAYRTTSPYRVGDSVTVLVGQDGSVWLEPEWDTRHAAERNEVRREKTMFYFLGGLTLACALFGAVLVVAVLKAKGPSPGESPDDEA
jgi:hypothetical protein